MSSPMDNIEVSELKLLRDNHGFFLKTMTSSMIGKYPAGEIYLSVAAPGSERADHYHKKATEWFSLIKGKCNLILSYKYQKRVIKLDSNEPKTVKIPPLVRHKFVNTGVDDAYLLAFTDVNYDPEDTLT